MEEEKNEKTRRRLPWWLIPGFALVAGLLFLPLLRGGGGGCVSAVGTVTRRLNIVHNSED